MPGPFGENIAAQVAELVRTKLQHSGMMQQDAKTPMHAAPSPLERANQHPGVQTSPEDAVAHFAQQFRTDQASDPTHGGPNAEPSTGVLPRQHGNEFNRVANWQVETTPGLARAAHVPMTLDTLDTGEEQPRALELQQALNDLAHMRAIKGRSEAIYTPRGRSAAGFGSAPGSWPQQPKALLS